MVGDIRQSVIATNPRSSKNKQYAYAEAIKWFREREKNDLLSIKEESITWRSRPEIAEFSDSIFDSSWAFPKTKSRNNKKTGHDGVFLLKREHLDEYISKYQPQCLRVSANSGKAFDLNYLNFGESKGTEYERVLIIPTGVIIKFIKKTKFLDPIPASKFYVAVTRAKQSVAIVLDKPGDSKIPYWSP